MANSSPSRNGREPWWDADPHPEYGPCDGFINGACSECARVIYGLRLALSETAPINDDLPLNCKAVAGTLDMRIGAKILAFAAENHPDLWDAEKDRGRFKVTDPIAFAQEVERALNHESEDGSTMLTRMLDAAVLEAIEQGGEGVEGE